ncbi:hypothetical protein [Leucobacter sp. M11]|uniref:hypothetical protein n=1 Tax=Leucobacter sp. M11 TaxID=2993565 RepID=UPI002D8093ED|nr:hypothetical protein [Leucobacter sp. M11]MEB4613377.1 hypothetical protein [Leucobacter sp. M11]
MSLPKDMRRAVGMVKKILRRRKLRQQVLDRLAERGPLPEGSYPIGVYFADSEVNLYQMRQWYAPLQELAKTHPVLVLARTAGGAHAMLAESGLDVAFVPKVTDLEAIVAEQQLKLVFYVNQNTRNFQMMRYDRRWHVFINHGESDKMYMTSNQFKAYDYAFVAGDAARARLGRTLWDYDVAERTLPIGRPQADHIGGKAPFVPDDRMVVFYAPTWEGDRPTARYGSVASHGVRLVRELLSTGRHRVVYRPHPRSGVVDAAFGEAHREIIAMIEQANAADPAAGHVYDVSPGIGWQLAVSNVAICDISAMIYDRLATGLPLLVTQPIAETAEIDRNGYLGECEWLAAADVPNIVDLLDRVVTDEVALDRLGRWSQWHFGDTRQGEPTRRFHAAIETLLARWDEWESRAAAPDAEHGAGVRPQPETRASEGDAPEA